MRKHRSLERTTRGVRIAVLLGTLVAGSQLTAMDFTRGDSNGDGTINIADAIFTLGYLFSNTVALECMDAADANDDGLLNIADTVFGLGALHPSPGVPPLNIPQPSFCGVDPTADNLDCASYAPCP